MCGIAVIEGKYLPGEMHKMLLSIKHRGPDDTGSYIKDNIALGQVRLSIIDVKGGHQPIFNEDRTKCIVFNGEIYNYKELKEKLKQKHVFSTKTDTEVILHLYEEEGPECIKKLDGMFAFAICDNGKLFIGRDRIGIKPLYFGVKEDTMYFASEIKALLECERVSVFLPGYYYVSGGDFIKYYELPGKVSISADIKVITAMVECLLEKAVQKRLMSDVPVGVFLSGGVDSSIIAAIMKKNIMDLNSFTVGMKDSDDLFYSQKVAEYLRTKHHEFVYTKKDLLEALPDVIYHLESFDAPLVRSALPSYFLSKLAGEKVKVVLAGEGADELFSGYKYLGKINEKKDLYKELYKITGNLHFTNLQRVDRMTMAHSVEGRVPFLDSEFLSYIISIPAELKQKKDRQEKWILREAFNEYLPIIIVNRPKQKFSAGAGSMEILKEYAEEKITDSDFKKEKNNRVRTKEELLYYRLFRERFPYSVVQCSGKTEVF
ncbi:MAG: asparagine synthase B [Candidatus Firestonebacteria bacterium]